MISLGKRSKSVWLVLITALGSPVALNAEDLPDGLTAAILVKVLELEEECCKTKDLRIHVMDDVPLAESLQKLVGKRIDEGRLSKVTYGHPLPKLGVDILLFNSQRNARTYIEYARRHGALSVTGNRRIVEDGVSLAIYNDEGMPGILLNNASSIREGKNWKPEILEIADLFEE